MRKFASLFVLFWFALAGPAFAQTNSEAGNSDSPDLSILESRTADAVAVLRGELAADAVFDGAFLAAVPPEQLAGLAKNLTEQFGALEGVESVTPSGARTAYIVLRFEKATGSGQIGIQTEAPQKINELLLTSFATNDDSLEKIATDIGSLPGEVGVLFTPLDGEAEPVFARNSDNQFAIGSTFKLYILSALARSVERGQRSWADVITLDRKSFPSGRLQNWPDGAPLTLHTLATLMISISDNTATDLLLHELGRETVEAELLRIGHSAPDKALPFLSTLEMFALKGSDGNLAKYIAADEAGKRFILADFEDDVGGDPGAVTPPQFSQPKAIETVEWFASPEDIKLLMTHLSQITDPTARQIMAVNSALPAIRRKDWAYIGYKGGSEPGVLSMSWLLQDQAEDWHMLTISWNDTNAPVDELTLDALAKRLLALGH